MSTHWRTSVVYMLRSLHAGIAVLVPALLALLLGIVVGGLTGSRRRGLNVLTPFLGHFGAWLAGMRIHIRQPANAHRHRPAIFVFNHQSGLDPIILCRVIGRNIVGIAKKELKYNPVLGPLLWFAETIFIDRLDQQQKHAAMQPALDALERGMSLAIAPEGTRHHRGTPPQKEALCSPPTLGKFRTGAFRLAIEAGVPVVPVVIHDAWKLLAPQRSDLHPGTVHVEVLDPVDTRPWREKDVDQLVQYVHAQMLERVCRFQPE